jgi:hypothetical protein
MLQIKTPRFVQRTMLVTCDGAWTTIKNAERESLLGGKALLQVLFCPDSTRLVLLGTITRLETT